MMLIDTFMTIHRCYNRMDFLKNSKGVSTGMEFGTLRIAESLQKKYPDQQTVFCIDSRKSWRKDKYPWYKGQREKSNREQFNGSDEEYREKQRKYYQRLNIFLHFLREAYPTAEAEGFEADDVMHCLSRRPKCPHAVGDKHFIYTNDHDLLQSVNKNVTVLKSFKSQIYEWDERKVKMEYEVAGNRLSEFFAFIGDKVDSIPGVPRIRRSYLAKLINWCHDTAKGDSFSVDKMLQEIKSAEWQPKMKDDIATFINSGQWHTNYELIHLKNRVSGLVVNHPNENSMFVEEKLREWETYSLKLAKHLGVERNLNEEEF